MELDEALEKIKYWSDTLAKIHRKFRRGKRLNEQEEFILTKFLNALVRDLEE